MTNVSLCISLPLATDNEWQKRKIPFPIFFPMLTKADRLIKTLPSCEAMENTLNVNRKLPKGEKKTDQRVNKNKTKSVLEMPARSSELF